MVNNIDFVWLHFAKNKEKKGRKKRKKGTKKRDGRQNAREDPNLKMGSEIFLYGLKKL